MGFLPGLTDLLLLLHGRTACAIIDGMFARSFASVLCLTTRYVGPHRDDWDCATAEPHTPPDELSCAVVSEVRFRRPGAVVVALVPRPTPALVRHAHDCGANMVADPDGAPVPLAADLRAFSDELGGRSVDRELLVRELGLSTDEVLWLGLLANGAGVDGVARSTGHSPRTMARLLHELYSKMEVDGWRAAVRQARSLGLLG